MSKANLKIIKNKPKTLLCERCGQETSTIYVISNLYNCGPCVGAAERTQRLIEADEEFEESVDERPIDQDILDRI